MKRLILGLLIVGGLATAGYYARDAWLSPAASTTGTTRTPGPAQPVLAGVVAQTAVPVELTTIGAVQPIATVLIKARLDGEIAAIHFEEGQEVKQGDLLFGLDARALNAQLRQAEANLARDRAQFGRAMLEMKRQQELVQRDFTSRQKLEQIQAEVLALEATVRSGEAAAEAARVTLSYTVIRSPISGKTGAVALKPGNNVKANDTAPLVTVTQMRPIYVSFTIPERQLAVIRTAREQGRVPVSAALPGQSSPPEEGMLTFIDNQVEAVTGTIGLKATFENAQNRLWPGQFVNVRMTLGVEADALVVPTAAVQTGQSGFYVFVIEADSRVKVRPIAVGRAHGDITVVTGVRAGERVVTDGHLRLTDGSRVNVIQPPTGQPPAAGREIRS